MTRLLARLTLKLGIVLAREQACQMKKLIINADDLGRCARVNCGIVEAYEKGIVTSATV